LDPNDAGIALAFALTDAALLPEDPALETLRPKFGFTAPFDTQFLWKKGGLLDLAQTPGTTCTDLSNLAKASIHHPSALAGGPDVMSTFDDKMTMGDLRDVGLLLVPRFDKLSHAFQTAAEHVDPSGVSIDGGCGIKKQRLQKPELYALASAFAIFEGLFTLAKAYDGALPFKQLFQMSDQNAWVQMMNAHWLHVVDKASLSAGRDLMRRALDLALSGIAAAHDVKSTPPDAVIDWLSFPPSVLTDAETLAHAGRDSLDKPVAIPWVTPVLTANGPAFVDSPFDLSNASPPIFSVGMGGGIQSDWSAVRAQLSSHFSPDPYGMGASFQWNINDRWSVTSDQWKKTFDPAGHFTSLYGCK
jgi:hypothetical protein